MKTLEGKRVFMLRFAGDWRKRTVFFARIQNGQMVEPHKVPDVNRAQCSACLEPVGARRGEILAWHWYHLSDTDCTGGGVETVWHQRWKNVVPPEYREVRVRNPLSGAVKVADIRIPCESGPQVYEVQYSQISSTEIASRVDVYARVFGEAGSLDGLTWIFDASERGFEIEQANDGRHHTIHRPYPWYEMAAAAASPVFLDFGDGHVFEVEKTNTKGTWALGWLRTDTFLEDQMRHRIEQVSTDGSDTLSHLSQLNERTVAWLKRVELYELLKQD